MSFNLNYIDNNNNISKDISSFYQDEILDEYENEDHKINEIKKNINFNNILLKIGSQYKPNRVKGDIDDVDKLEFDSKNKNINIKENNKTIINSFNNKSNNNLQNFHKNEKEKSEKTNNINNNNETQFYELNTNKLVDIIKNDYNDIYVKQNEDIIKFIDILAKDNSLLKVEINKLKSENIKIKTQNEFIKNYIIIKMNQMN